MSPMAAVHAFFHTNRGIRPPTYGDVRAHTGWWAATHDMREVSAKPCLNNLSQTMSHYAPSLSHSMDAAMQRIPATAPVHPTQPVQLGRHATTGPYARATTANFKMYTTCLYSIQSHMPICDRI